VRDVNATVAPAVALEFAFAQQNGRVSIASCVQLDTLGRAASNVRRAPFKANAAMEFLERGSVCAKEITQELIVLYLLKRAIPQPPRTHCHQLIQALP